MNYAKLILESILKEEANQQQVIDAIKKHREARILYNADGEPKGRKLRIIQPVAYGKSKSGNLVVRAFQPMGDTKTKTPHWKMFRLDKIDKWVTTRKTFEEPPASQWNSNGAFNPNGDKDMSEVYTIANFNGKPYNLQRYNQQKEKEGYEKTPYYGLEQKLKQKKYHDGNQIDYIKKNVENWQKHNNVNSVFDMARAKDFGDDNETETMGPVKRNSIEPETPNQNTPNYTNAMQNGPVKKGTNVYNDENKETSEDENIENNDEREI